MLRASNRVLKPGGMTAYFTIFEAEDDEIGMLAKGADYPELMTEAGFAHISVEDVTVEYEATLAGWIREWDVERAHLERLTGPEAFAERRAHRLEDMGAIREGRRRRFLISGTRP